MGTAALKKSLHPKSPVLFLSMNKGHPWYHIIYHLGVTKTQPSILSCLCLHDYQLCIPEEMRGDPGKSSLAVFSKQKSLLSKGKRVLRCL